MPADPSNAGSIIDVGDSSLTRPESCPFGLREGALRYLRTATTRVAERMVKILNPTIDHTSSHTTINSNIHGPKYRSLRRNASCGQLRIVRFYIARVLHAN